MGVIPTLTPTVNKTITLYDLGIGNTAKFSLVSRLSTEDKKVYSAVGTDDKWQFLVTFQSQHVTNFSSALNLLNKPRTNQAQKSSITLEWIKRVPATEFSPAYDQPQKAVFTYLNTDGSELDTNDFNMVISVIASLFKFTDNTNELSYLDKGSIEAAKEI